MGLFWTRKSDQEDIDDNTANPWAEYLVKGNLNDTQPHYNVVAAVVVRDGKYLCVRRRDTKYPYTSHKWEFPGGKIEHGEEPQQALSREMLEELDYPVEVGNHIVGVEYPYPDFRISLKVYFCAPTTDAEPVLKEHAELCWLEESQLKSLDWCAADTIVVQAIVDNY